MNSWTASNALKARLELMYLLKGKYINDHVSIWYYRLDDIAEVEGQRPNGERSGHRCSDGCLSCLQTKS